MLDAVMIWNEPNNKSHWDFTIDPDWSAFAEMARLAGEAVVAEDAGIPRVLGGISPIDPLFIQNARPGRSRARRRGGRARLSARLEPLDA
jgi:beta-xylosidase